MLMLDDLLADAEAGLVQHPALTRCVQLGICYGLLRATLGRYLPGNPVELSQTALQLMETLVRTKTLDALLFGDTARPLREAEAYVPMPPVEPPAPVIRRRPAPVMESADPPDERTIRHFLRAQGMKETEIAALLRLYKGEVSVQEDPESEVQSNSDDDQVRREAAEMNPLYGVAGFSSDPPGNFSSNGEGLTK